MPLVIHGTVIQTVPFSWSLKVLYIFFLVAAVYLWIKGKLPSAKRSPCFGVSHECSQVLLFLDRFNFCNISFILKRSINSFESRFYKEQVFFVYFEQLMFKNLLSSFSKHKVTKLEDMCSKVW